MTSSRYRAAVILLIVFGALLRLVFVLSVHPLGNSIYSDMANYVGNADGILKGEWRDGYFFQPIGYSLLIALLKISGGDWLGTLGWIHIVAASATLALVWWASLLSFGRSVALIALAVSASHLAWILFAGFALPETLFTLLLAALALASIWVVRDLSWQASVLWGTIFFLALLLKGTHILVVPIFLVALIAARGRRALGAAVVISVVVWVGLIGHGLFTQATIGSFQMTGTAGGLNFVEGKCAIKGNTDSTGASWLSPLYYQLGKTEMQTWDHPFTESAYFFKAGLQCIRDNPAVLLQSLEGIPFLLIGNWMWPVGNLAFQDWIRLYEMAFSIVAVGGACGFLMLSMQGPQAKEHFLVWLVPIIGLMACVYLFKSEVRFRVPFDVWLIPLMSKGWFDLWTARRMRNLPKMPI